MHIVLVFLDLLLLWHIMGKKLLKLLLHWLLVEHGIHHGELRPLLLRFFQLNFKCFVLNSQLGIFAEMELLSFFQLCYFEILFKNLRPQRCFIFRGFFSDLLLLLNDLLIEFGNLILIQLKQFVLSFVQFFFQCFLRVFKLTNMLIFWLHV